MNAGAWDAFAAREPYFAVLTHERYLRKHFDPAAEAEFFDSGEAYVSDLYSILGTRVASHFAPASVLEYGCGVGRLLLPFARRATRVTGVDVSKAMLETARMHLAKAGITNVELLPSLDDRTFDLVNCVLVLQRLPVREGLELLRRLTRHVREGGVGVFQFPLSLHDLATCCFVASGARSGAGGECCVQRDEAKVGAVHSDEHVRSQRGVRGAARRGVRFAACRVAAAWGD